MKTWLIAVIATFVDLIAAGVFFLRGDINIGIVMLIGAGFGFALVYQLARRGQ